MSLVIDLQTTKDREIEMSAPNEAERHRAIECARTRQCGNGTAAGVRQRGMRHAFFRRRAGADQPVLRLKENAHAVWNVVCHQGRNSNAEIDEHAGFQLASDSACNDYLRFHSPLTYWRPGSRPDQARVSQLRPFQRIQSNLPNRRH